MAIVFLEEKKRQQFLILVLVVVLLAIFVVFWRSFFIKPSKQPVSLLPAKPPEIKINFEALKSPILKDLQPFEEIIPTTEPVGRENPFLPY